METETHVRIVRAAIDLLNHNTIREYAKDIISGSFNEDFISLFRIKFGFPVLTHFYSPTMKKGFWIFKGARQRALRYFSRAVKAYKKGNKNKAFDFLGRCAHLLTDMATPTHTKLIRHYFNKDALEEYAQKVDLPSLKFDVIKREKVAEFFDETANISSKLNVFKVNDLEDKEKLKKIKKQHKLLLGHAINYTAALFLHFVLEVQNADSE